MPKLSALLLALLLSTSAHALERCLVLGDSIAAGFGASAPSSGALLQTDKRGENFAVNVAAVPGYTSAQALSLLQSTYSSALGGSRGGYTCLIIMVGTNDYPVSGLLAAATIANIGTMITTARAAGVGRILVGQVLPSSTGPSYSATKQTQVDAVNAWIASLTTATPVLLYAALGKSGVPEELEPTYSVDGLHTNAAGQARVKTELAALL